MQIDVIRIEHTTVVCNLQTGDRDVRIIMTLDDYEALKWDRFFVRSTDRQDSAGVYNTTAEYDQIQYVDGNKSLIS